MNICIAIGRFHRRQLVAFRTKPWELWKLRERIRVQRELAERCAVTCADMDRKDEHDDGH